MTNNIQIRKATAADIDNIVTLYNATIDYLETHKNYPCWKKDVYPTREDATDGLEKEQLYVAMIGEKIAGTMILKNEPVDGYEAAEWLTKADYQNIIVIHTLAVHPDFMKNRVAWELLQFAERLGRDEQYASIRLDVVKGNIPAERLYQKSGYQFIGTVSLGYEAYGIPWYNLYEKVLH